MSKLSKFFFYLFFAFLPFQIDALLVSGDVYFSGFFNPYLSHFIYASDVFLLLSLFFLAFSKGFSLKGRWGIIGACLLLVMYVISMIFSVDRVNSLFYCIRLLEFLVVFFLISVRFVSLKKLLYIFIGVVSFTAFVGIFQYVFQESLGLRFLGEPIISSEKLGVAKVGLFDRDVLRVYGTFAHPNIFAGYLIFAIFFIIYCLKDSKVLFSLLLLVCFLALLLTFSRSAFLAVFVALLLYFAISNMRPSVGYVIMALALFLFFAVTFDLFPVLTDRVLLGDTANLTERGLYLSISERMFFGNVFGVGAGNFTAVMQDYTSVKLMPWLYQPVHNMFLLLLNEIGIQGLAAFLGFFGFLIMGPVLGMKKNRPFANILTSLGIVILVVGIFDHYFISLYQGQALFWLWAGLCGVGSRL